MQGISRLFIVLLACAGVAAAQAIPPYYLLSAHQSATSEAINEADFNISVDRNLDVSGVRSVICQLIRTEKPKGYEILSIGIYYKLDRYSPESERDLQETAEHRAHRIAQYHWSKDSPKDSRRLVLNKDAKGQPLETWRFYNFDHSKECR